MECLQLVLDLSLQSPRKLLILREFTVHFDSVLDSQSEILGSFEFIKVCFSPDTYVYIYMYVYIYIFVFLISHSLLIFICFLLRIKLYLS